MYKESDIVVHRLKEDKTTAIGIVDEVDSKYISISNMWVHPDANTFNFNRLYQLNDHNKSMIKHLNDPEVIKNGKELFKILFEGERI